MEEIDVDSEGLERLPHVVFEVRLQDEFLHVAEIVARERIGQTGIQVSEIHDSGIMAVTPPELRYSGEEVCSQFEALSRGRIRSEKVLENVLAQDCRCAIPFEPQPFIFVD